MVGRNREIHKIGFIVYFEEIYVCSAVAEQVFFSYRMSGRNAETMTEVFAD